ncbi:MAG: transporter substrate-binding domain-containing protein [Enterobacteriaceae bacterium]|jgi:polar amino acid transport system substrate-binding protein|nr:transporter substrate-binding domain-containing protein [Enterobacteriaceae bacterium]
MKRIKPNKSTLFRRLALTAVIMIAIPAVVQADATLDKINSRHKVAIGVLVNGGDFGSVDPATQKLVGWNPDLARKLAQDLGVEAELVPVQTATRTQFLLAGKVDLLIASMELNPERAESMGYAPTPFYRVGGTALTLKTSGITKWEDLRGKPVCVSQGSSFARPLAEQYGAVTKGYKSSSDSLLALQGGQCAAAVHDSTLIHPLVRKGGEWAQYQAPIKDELLPADSVVWTRKGEADTIAAVDKIVKSWHKTGWLIDEEKRLGITPPQPLLETLHKTFSAAN